MTATLERPRLPFALRDLTWAITSPMLLRSDCLPWLADSGETAGLLKRLEADPAPLLAAIGNPAALNLGRYFEALIRYWLSELESVEMVASNFPIRRERQTIGEIDLLFRHGDAIFHWELAAKFYLNIGAGGREEEFVGPGLRDRLDIKLGRLFGHQLRLGDRAETRAALPSLDTAPRAFPFVKGCLFDPFGSHPIPRPERIAGDALRGLWCPRGALLENERLPAFSHFRLLEKHRWITPAFYPDEVTEGGIPALRAAIAPHFEKRRMPVMVALMRDEGAPMLDVQARLFVTPDDWLSHARKAHLDEKSGERD
ncbi:DUF1853 family protein [Sneathiella sp.]|uniref:DUF1853 family protein n=1 Tax=Sneathiella sp. TaxID=1964365 RepID=UPI002FDFEEE0